MRLSDERDIFQADGPEQRTDGANLSGESVKSEAAVSFFFFFYFFHPFVSF